MTRILLFAIASLWLSKGMPATPPAVSLAQDTSGQDMARVIREYVFKNVPAEKPGTDAASRTQGQAEGFVGREDLYVGRTFSRRAKCIPLDADPLKVLAERARKTNIVVINEHHASPQDRDFIGKALVTLRQEGYSIYAAETFTQFDNLDHPDVLGFDGWYSNEPMFGRTLRLAKSLGYRFVAYEQTGEQTREAPQESSNSNAAINRREQDQTRNLMSAIFTKDPDARVVIHVGHSHVREREPSAGPDGRIWMAQRLKEATGRDPLTISQITCNSPAMDTVAAEAYLTSDGTRELATTVDLYVGLPSLTFKAGRPGWRQEIGDTQVEIPASLLGSGERTIVEARPEGAPLGTVPVDRILLFPGERLPLLLPPGRYRVDGFTAAGRVAVPPIVLQVE